MYQKDDKYYDLGQDGHYHEYTAGYTNDDGYEYKDGAFHKDGKSYKYEDGYKNAEGYEYDDGVYQKDGKYYDLGQDGQYHEHTAGYTNAEGYEYKEGVYFSADDFHFDHNRFNENDWVPSSNDGMWYV